MGFNFFKKETCADRIFMNGNIYTQDFEMPWADAVACKDGKIIAVGNYSCMDDLHDDNTEIVDLKEKFMFPGFIDAHSSTVLSTFKDTYLELDSNWDFDTILGELYNYCDTLSEGDTAFAYGFNESLLDDFNNPEEIAALLDEIETECPIVLLGNDGHHILLNTVASQIVKTICEDENVANPSLSFVLDALMLFDPEELENNFNEEEERLTDKGFTSVFNYGAPSYFDSVYRNIMLEKIGDSESLNQKFYGSFMMNRPANPKFVVAMLNSHRTFCSELDGLIHFNTLKIFAGGDENPSEFTQDYLNELCLAVADKGYNIHIDALDQDILEKTYNSFELVRSKGYEKNNLIIASDLKMEKEKVVNYDYADTFCLTYASDMLNNSVFSHSVNVHDAIDKLTINAAEILGEKENLGSIEKGKYADFTVFSENIFDTNLKTFSRLHSDMIVVNGEVMYDVDEENYDEMVNLLMNMQM